MQSNICLFIVFPFFPPSSKMNSFLFVNAQVMSLKSCFVMRVNKENVSLEPSLGKGLNFLLRELKGEKKNQSSQRERDY